MSGWKKGHAVVTLQETTYTGVSHLMSMAECMIMAGGGCLFACLQLSICVFQLDCLWWLYDKSMSAFTFYSSLSFCVTGLKGTLCFRGEDRHRLPVSRLCFLQVASLVCTLAWTPHSASRTTMKMERMSLSSYIGIEVSADILITASLFARQHKNA